MQDLRDRPASADASDLDAGGSAAAGAGIRSRTAGRYGSGSAGVSAGVSGTHGTGTDLLVDDGPVGPHQLLASTFVDAASQRVRAAVDAELGVLAAVSAPAETFLAPLTRRDRPLAAAVEALAPGASAEASAHAMLDRLVAGVTARVRQQAGSAHGGPLSAAPRRPRSPGQQGLEEDLSPEVRSVVMELRAMIEQAQWRNMRPAIYARETADEEGRARERRDGTLEDLGGIGSIASLDRLAAKLRELQSGWAQRTQAERMNEIFASVNEELAAAHVPVLVAVVENTRPALGSFVFPTWELALSRELLRRPSLADEHAQQLCEVTAHEARHAEQFYLAARVAAARGAGLAQLRSQIPLPDFIIQHAIDVKLRGLSGSARALATRMHDSIIVRRAEQIRVLDDTGFPEMDAARTVAQQALATLVMVPTPENIVAADQAMAGLRSAMKAADAKYVTYRALGSEADAHEVGAAASLAFEHARVPSESAPDG